MTDKETSSPNKGEFIDLEKNQYKKKTNYSRNVILILALVIVCFFSSFYVFNSGLIKDVLKKGSRGNQEIVEKKDVSNNEDFYNKKINEILNRVQVLDEKTFANNLKLSEIASAVSEIDGKIKILENNQSSGSGLYDSDKYFVLADLLTLRNNFANRRNPQKELNRLISRFNNNTEIKILLIFFQDSVIEKIKTKEYLLDELNKKISFYEENIEEFIDKFENQSHVERNKIFESKENFVKYFKNLISTTYKITKIENGQRHDHVNVVQNNGLLTSLKNTKEYLLLGNLDKAVYTLENSNFDNAEIDQWIEDARSLRLVLEKLQVLETELLSLIGKDFD